MELDDLLDPKGNRRDRFEIKSAQAISDLRKAVGDHEDRLKIQEQWRAKMQPYWSLALGLASAVWYVITKALAERLMK